MGYYTYFTLTKIEGSDEDFDNLVKEIKDDLDIDLAEGEEAKWYDHDEDLIERSKKYPGLLVELYGDGENSDDLWSTRYRNGESETVELPSLPPFRRLLSEKEVAGNELPAFVKEIRTLTDKLLEGEIKLNDELKTVLGQVSALLLSAETLAKRQKAEIK